SCSRRATRSWSSSTTWTSSRRPTTSSISVRKVARTAAASSRPERRSRSLKSRDPIRHAFSVPSWPRDDRTRMRPAASTTLPRVFYDRPTLDVAHDLIGKVLVHLRRGVRTSGMIVEVEAYIGEMDPACHAAPGRTLRNAPLYGTPGHAYVYLNYGIHSMMNVV